MKPETNKEIDLLLRRMAQGNGAAREGGVPRDDQHLDADELSSYAQNALPAAARARYMEHLADCATCRGLVTELSLSLGSAAVAEPVEAVAGLSGWKKFLASLLSPMVLRYAVPALGVIVVMVVGFVVLRRQQRSEFTARLEPRQVTAPSVTPKTPDTNGFVDGSQAKQVDKLESQNSKTETKVKSESGRADDSVATAASVPTVRDEKLAESQRPAAPAPEQPTPEAKTDAADRERQQETAIAAKKEPETAKEKAEAEPKSANEAPRDQAAAKPAGTAQSQPTATQSSDSGFVGGLRGLSARRAETAKTGAAAKSREEDKDANATFADDATKTIAGHHFRKQGKVWIDTSYQSSTATVNMARDSEQFRALVADEPTIGTIAKQLDGEVIVVWKGHAYRIR